MFNKFRNKLPKNFWRILAIFIIMAVAGPDIIFGMEVAALMELVGAETFVLMYMSSLFLYFGYLKARLRWLLKKIEKIERYSWFCIPSKEVISEYPPCIWFVVPTSTCLWLMMLLPLLAVMTFQ